MFKTILCATDLKEDSISAFKKAIQIAHQFNSKIYLINIREEFINKDRMIMSRVSIDTVKSKFRDIAVKAKNEMNTLIKDLEAEEIDIEILLKEGKPCNTIIEHAESLSADLIIMGTNGNDSLKDYVLGSTANNVCNDAKCPVLIVPKD
tara:strand:+ start:632 stop:1078 length:447 start_codon:yes stop_codon:yes gene_type:complete